jgi:twitching motility protein PilT
MKSITPERIQQEFEETGSGDFGFAFGDAARFRVSIFKQKGYCSLVLRRIPNSLLTFEQIGLPEMARSICRRPRGIFLVTGPTGSGKTTTLACMINYINETYDKHIITMEDPIEYYHPHKKSVVVQREIGTDCPTFAEGLRRALRQDPDVILVGEMRDLTTIGSAITAAETASSTPSPPISRNRSACSWPVTCWRCSASVCVRASTPTAWLPVTNSCTSRPAFRT